jgi:hypothetical protein
MYDNVIDVSRTDAMINLLTEFNRNRAGIVEGLESFMQESNHTPLPYNEYKLNININNGNKKRKIHSCSLLLALGQFTLPSCNQVKPTNQIKPNIVYILADDLGRHQVGAYGETDFYETPNIDRLAEQGLIFMNAYATAPVCSPTRASIMTGKYPARTNLTVNIPNTYHSRRLNTALFQLCYLSRK